MRRAPTPKVRRAKDQVTEIRDSLKGFAAEWSEHDLGISDRAKAAEEALVALVESFEAKIERRVARGAPDA